MQVAGMIYGARLSELGNFPALGIPGPDAGAAQIEGLIERHGAESQRDGAGFI